jgi:glycerol uptake facilitator-like aquaporin
MIAALMIGIVYFAMEQTMRSISGGPMNPTIALA